MTLSWERVAGRSPDGCGARSKSKFVPPLIRRRGGTFPQGKVGGYLPSAQRNLDRSSSSLRSVSTNKMSASSRLFSPSMASRLGKFSMGIPSFGK